MLCDWGTVVSGDGNMYSRRKRNSRLDGTTVYVRKSGGALACPRLLLMSQSVCRIADITLVDTKKNSSLLPVFSKAAFRLRSSFISSWSSDSLLCRVRPADRIINRKMSTSTIGSSKGSVMPRASNRFLLRPWNHPKIFTTRACAIGDWCNARARKKNPKSLSQYGQDFH